ncbi:MAG TPA: type II toxin-antitoxin system RelE/ParE family toxin [Verrucomicrobiae bacterium]|jgi:plasmid stabilization system protein ParE
MDFKVFLSDDALSDLERIVAYIAPHNAISAERMGNQLLDAALSLRTFPERGRMVPEFRRAELREIIFRSYRIIYRMNGSDQSLEIVRFWHGARGFPHIPNEGQNA